MTTVLTWCSRLGREEAAGLSGSSTQFLGLALSGRGGQVVAGAGGPQAALKSPSQPSCHGQFLGRCITRRRAELARRAGTAMSWRRMVAVVALVWKTDARVPAARVRLNAIAASTS